MDNSFWYQYLSSSAIGLILYHTFAEFDSYGTLMSLFCFVQLSNNTVSRNIILKDNLNSAQDFHRCLEALVGA